MSQVSVVKMGNAEYLYGASGPSEISMGNLEIEHIKCF